MAGSAGLRPASVVESVPCAPVSSGGNAQTPPCPANAAAVSRAPAGDKPPRYSDVAGLAGDKPPRYSNGAGQAGDEPPRYGKVAGQAGDEPPRYSDVAGQAGDKPPRYSNGAGLAGDKPRSTFTHVGAVREPPLRLQCDGSSGGRAPELRSVEKHDPALARAWRSQPGASRVEADPSQHRDNAGVYFRGPTVTGKPVSMDCRAAAIRRMASTPSSPVTMGAALPAAQSKKWLISR